MTEAKNKPDLARSAARGAGVTLVSQASKLALQLVGMVVLARLLMPEDYGLLAMVTAVIGVGELIRDFGLTQAAMQAKSLNQRQQSNLFWINSVIGVFLGLAVFLSAPLIAQFYGDSRIEVVTQALAVTFFFNGASTQFRAHLNRALRFGMLAIVDLSAISLGLTVGIVMATKGFGYWALVGQLVVHSAVALCIVVVLAHWLPGLPKRVSGMAPLLRFGFFLTMSQMFGYASRNIDSVLVGSRFGAGPLGYYDRAFQLLMLPLNQIQAPATNVALPVLARLQDDPPRFSAYLLRGQLVLIHVIVGAFCFLWIDAEWLVEIVFGSNWGDSVPLLRILLLGGIFQAASYATYWVFLAKGLTASNLRYSIVSRIIVIGCIAVGALGTPSTIAAGYAVGMLLVWPFGLWWIGRISDAPVLQMFAGGARTLGLYIVAGFVSVAVCSWWLGLTGILDAAARVVVACLMIVLLGALVPRLRKDYLEIFELAKLIRKTGK